jgi:hypothetical protein
MTGKKEGQCAIQLEVSMWLRKRGDKNSLKGHVVKRKGFERSFSDHVTEKGGNEKVRRGDGKSFCQPHG